MAEKNIDINLEDVGKAFETVGISGANANKALESLSRSLRNASIEKPKQNWLGKFLNRIVDLFRKI